MHSDHRHTNATRLGFGLFALAAALLAPARAARAQDQVKLDISQTDIPDPVVAGFALGGLEYDIEVDNDGSVDATNVKVNQGLFGGGSDVVFHHATVASGTTYDSATGAWSIPSLPKGGGVILSLFYTVKASAKAGTDVLADVATIVSADQPIDPASTTDSTEKTSITRQVDFKLTETESIDPVISGSGPGNLKHVFTLKNNGPSDASDVNVATTHAIPAIGVTLDSVTPNSGTFMDPNWKIPTLASGASGTLTFTFTVASSAHTGTDVIQTSGMVTAANETITNPGDDSASQKTSILQEIDLTVTKTESVDPVVAGSGSGNLTYTVTVKNNGPSDATNIKLNEVITVPAFVTVDKVNVDTGSFVSPTWTFSLLAGASAHLTATITVGPSADKGTDVIADTATVTGADQQLTNTGDDSATEKTSITTLADVSIVKTASSDRVEVGKTLTYTFTIHNDGPSDARSVTFKDTLPTQFDFVKTTAPAGWICNESSGKVTCTLDRLHAGETDVLTIVVKARTARDVVTNTGTVSSTTQDPNPDNNSSSVDVRIFEPAPPGVPALGAFGAMILALGSLGAALYVLNRRATIV